ncbi:4a-hydroxytetrahydrobiopterin dehydratase [Micromonospora zhanjiangensis]|uniref:Putative pterin-4-alpha-carbinolamine dehydratase n=1 Tax=Micromonospora zhanjiangensis TaxID=1522057 RepID=A0ABV8KL85_9ACTN
MIRALWSRAERDHLDDALAQLDGWIREGCLIKRTLVLTDAQHAELTERTKIAADVLNLRPEIRRLDGRTQIKITPRDCDELTDREVTLAARIEDVHRALTHDED